MAGKTPLRFAKKENSYAFVKPIYQTLKIDFLLQSQFPQTVHFFLLITNGKNAFMPSKGH